MILENSMLSKDKLIYLLKNESISPLNNDKRYKGLNNILQEFGEFWQNPLFFFLQYLGCSDAIKIQNPTSAEIVGEKAPFTKILDF